MKYLSTFILSFLFLAKFFNPSQGNLYAQSTILNSTLPATSSEMQSDPYRSKLYKVRGIPDLQVTIPSGNIEVFSNSQIDGVKVDLYVKRSFSLWSGTRSLDTYRIVMQQRGDQIIASVEDTRSGRSSDRGSIEFSMVVQVPVETSTNLRALNGGISLYAVRGNHFLQNQTGDISVQNSDGNIRVVSTTGNVTLNDLKGNIYAKTVSGRMHVENSEGEVRLRSVTGDIRAGNMSGTLVSGTTSGNIDATFNEVAVGIYMETVSGDINLSIPPGAGYTINGKAMRFNFNELNQASITSRSVSNRDAIIVIREGKLPVNLSTLSGQVLVRESNQ